MTDKDNLRVGDSDRELVTRLLKVAVDEGRLSLAEYDERLQEVLGAKTVGELSPIVSDLPRPGDSVIASADTTALTPAPQGRRTQPSDPIDGTPAWVKWMWFGWAVPVSINLVVWVLVCLGNGEFIYFWPAWIAGPLGAVFLCLTGAEKFLIRPYLEEQKRERGTDFDE